MSKFKVGDRVRILRDGDECTYWCEYSKGDVHEVTHVYHTGDYEVGWQTMHPNDIEPVTTYPFTIGQTYQSKNGNKWECIAIKGNVVWLAGDYGNGAEGSAYAFELDGTPICLGSDADRYRIVFAPVVTHHDHYAETKHGDVVIDYDVIDGKPDWDNAKVTPAL